MLLHEITVVTLTGVTSLLVASHIYSFMGAKHTSADTTVTLVAYKEFIIHRRTLFYNFCILSIMVTVGLKILASYSSIGRIMPFANCLAL